MTGVSMQPHEQQPHSSYLEQEVRAFAAEFDTPNTRYMVALCEAGRITWAQAYDIARKALDDGLRRIGAAR